MKLGQHEYERHRKDRLDPVRKCSFEVEGAERSQRALTRLKEAGYKVEQAG